MYRFTIPFCIFLFLFSIKGFSQNGDYSWRLGIGGGLTNYYGDLSYQFISGKDYIRQFDTQSTPWMLSANLEKRISSSWGINLQAGWGYLVGNDRARDWDGNLLTENPDISRALNFRTEIKKADLLLAYHFDNDRILRRDAAISPYLFGGVGMTQFAVWGDLFTEDGTRYYYQNDFSIRGQSDNPSSPVIQQDKIFETRLDGLGTETDEGYSTLILHIPMGVGIDFKLSQKVILGLQSQVNYAFTDYLDDVSGPYRTFVEDPVGVQAYASNPGLVNTNIRPNRGNPNNQNDWYGSLQVFLSFQFGEKVRRFKSPRFYGTNTPNEDSSIGESEIVPEEKTEDNISPEPTLDEVIAEKEETIQPLLISDAKEEEQLHPDTTKDVIEDSQPLITDSQVVDSQATDSGKPIVKENTRGEEITENKNETQQDLSENISPQPIQNTNQGTSGQQNEDLKKELESLTAEIRELNQRVKELESQPLVIKMDIQDNEKESQKSEKTIQQSKVTKEQNLTKEVKEQSESVNEQKLTNKDSKPGLELSGSSTSVAVTQGNKTSALADSSIREIPQVSIDSAGKTISVINPQISQDFKPDTVIMLTSGPKVNLVIQDSTRQKKDSVTTNQVTINDSLKIHTAKAKTDSAQVNNKPAEVKKTETSSIRGLHKGQVFFSLGSSKIRPSEEEVLNEVKQIMETNPALQLVLKGFADPSGNAQRNLILSQKRAEAVAEYLVSRGIEKGRIDTTSLGDKIQKYGEAALDRRVELILVWE